MSKSVKMAAAIIAIFTVVVIVVFGILKLQKSRQGSQNVQQQSIEAAIQKEFSAFKIESQESFEGLQKVILIVSDGNGITSPTSDGKATMFFKNGVRQNIPENYLKGVIGSNKTNPGDKILSVKYHEYFSNFGPKTSYSKVYLGQVELSKPAREGNSQLLGGPLTHQFFLFDQYGSLISKNFGTAPIE